jgi:hypothetical protein
MVLIGRGRGPVRYRLRPTDLRPTLLERDNAELGQAGGFRQLVGGPMPPQVVGLQWQFTCTDVGPDAGAPCPIGVSITGIKFLQAEAVDAAAPATADAATSA